MAYFLPSYFQKRLLRYALSRLDFIETDDLDLENLGITFGQRSVVELRNVAIKIKNITKRVPLPPSVLLNQASIALLRLTIPADLHVSGIEVEVDGIDVAARVLHEEQGYDTKETQGRPASRPSRTDRANRPRISSPSVHDPGGRDRPDDDGGHIELSQVIPSSQDLALSFLDSESLEERQELQAAIESGSHYMQDSAMSSSFGEESGLGLPGGLTLPGFVANFFKGVADRLSVKISNVALSIQMELSTSAAGERDTVMFMLRIGAFDVEGLDSKSASVQSPEISRIIKIRDLDFGILADREALSVPGSPKLTRSQSKLSSTVFEGVDNRNVQGNEAKSFRSQTSTSNSDSHLENSAASSRDDLTNSSFGFQSTLGLGIDRSLDTNAQISASMGSGTSTATSHLDGRGTEDFYEVDNRAHAEQIANSGNLSHVNTQDPVSRSDIEGLSESRLFTHDEAESMYMSAVSNDHAEKSTRHGMPGGWAWSDAVQEQSPEASVKESTSIPKDTDMEDLSKTFEKATHLQAAVQAASTSTSVPQSTRSEIDEVAPSNPELQGLCFMRVVRLDFVSVTLPDQLQKEVDEYDRAAETRTRAEMSRSLYRTGSQSAGTVVQGSGPRSVASHASQLRGIGHLDQSIMNAEQRKRNKTVDIQIGCIELDLDMSASKLFVRVAQSVINRFSSRAAAKPSTGEPRRATSDVEISLNRIQVRFCENISRQSGVLSPSESGISIPSEPPLLLLSILHVRYKSVTSPVEDQRLTVGKLSCQHSARDVLNFVDSVDVRDSISSSSMLRPHDIVATRTGGRAEVQIKPIHILLDLLVVDEVLSRSGGLSSLLDLGNSITSTGTIKALTSKKSTAVQPRSVRFNAPHKRTRSDSDPSSSSKINVRFSGCILDLVGSEASIQVKSSAIKVVYRQDNIRVGIDGAAVEGPLLSNSKAVPAIFAKLKRIELHYSDSPEETDLDRLLSLLTPSNNQYDKDDDIMVDTLLRQRRKGGVLRLNLGEIQLSARGLAWQAHLTKLSDELARLSSVAKYLPEDDRPGILTFVLINKFDLRFQVDESFGPIDLKADLLEAAHISIPSLAAAQISSWSLARGNDAIIGEVVSQENAVMGPPMLMCRFIADEMDPTVRTKFTNTCVEYKVSTLVAVTDLIERLKPLLQLDKAEIISHQSSPTSSTSEGFGLTKRIKISVTFRDSALALYPSDSPAKGLFMLTDAVVNHSGEKRGSRTTIDIRKGSLLVIDNTEFIGSERENADHKLYFDQNDEIQELTRIGFVPIGSMSSASVIVRISEENQENHEQQVDVELRNTLLFLETCADSTQTLFQILGGLAPPTHPSPVAKYRTEIVPIQDMLASFTGNAFVSETGPELGLQASRMMASTASSDEGEDEGFMGDFYRDDGEEDEEMNASYMESELAGSTAHASLHVAPVEVDAPDAADLGQSMTAHSLLDFRTDHFVTKSSVGGTAHRWDSTKNAYDLGSDTVFQKSPLKVRIRDVHFIWNLFDGYDWKATRDTISQAVKEIETKAMARRPRSTSRLSPGAEEDDESVIGDFLFNSIYIGIPANKNPRDLTNAINQDIDDLVSETGSYATGTTVTASPSRQSGPRSRPKKLKLNRSKQHKMTFELEGVSADIVAFPPGSGEVESSIDVRVKKLEVFDHIPSSTWKKFATYMQDAGEREVDTNMVHLELLNVKPIAELTASEIVLKVTILPLRLHVDQDALDFMSRFFEFKDDRAPVSTTPSNPPFLQRVEVNPVQVKLDFKPKRVDYAGLRSGRTTEFMNFFVLDRADMVLRRVILYGVPGFERLGIMLNNIWSPDVRRNQLPGVLAGLAPIRPLVDVGSGVRDLIAIPIREYKKDGRVVRSIQKGAMAFAKTTATELVNLGAKLAIGTQQVLQTAEGMLVSTEEDEDIDDEMKRQISLYADQPLGIVQGLRGAYASLERDLLLAKDAIVAVPGEIMASGSATGAAKAVLKQSPTIILRPAIGASKAVGQTLLGAGNTLDRRNLRRIEEKYKRH